MSLDLDPLGALAERALAGDRTALERLCEKLHVPVFRLSLRVLGSPSDASDATQEILIHVVTHLSQFRGESLLLTWVYTMATRHLLRSRKKLARERSVEVLETHIRMGLAVTNASSAPEGEVRVLERETRLGCTSAMLRCLSMEERLAIVLDELGADNDLGAKLCDVTPPAYRKRLSRAREKLKPILEDLCGLTRPDAPCTCTRQARAKQIAGVETMTYHRLPLARAAAPEVRQAMEGLSSLHRIGPVFAGEPIDPPEEVWAELRRRLPTLLGGPH